MDTQSRKTSEQKKTGRRRKDSHIMHNAHNRIIEGSERTRINAAAQLIRSVRVWQDKSGVYRYGMRMRKGVEVVAVCSVEAGATLHVPWMTGGCNR